MWETTQEKWQIYSFVFTLPEEDNHESTTHTDVSVPPASSRSLNFQNLKSRKVKHMVDSEQQTVTSFILPLFGCCHIPHDKIHWLHPSLSSLSSSTAEKSKTNHQRANDGKRQREKNPQCFHGTRWQNDRCVTLSCCSDFVSFTTNWIKYKIYVLRQPLVQLIEWVVQWPQGWWIGSRLKLSTYSIAHWQYTEPQFAPNGHSQCYQTAPCMAAATYCCAPEWGFVKPFGSTIKMMKSAV